MEINATLIAQGCNFFVAYLLVKHLLLKPGIRQLDEERAEHELVHEQLTQGRDMLAQLQQDERAYEEAVRHSLARLIPPVHEAQMTMPRIVPLPDAAPLDAQERLRLQQELVTQIVREVEHG